MDWDDLMFNPANNLKNYSANQLAFSGEFLNGTDKRDAPKWYAPGDEGSIGVRSVNYDPLAYVNRIVSKVTDERMAWLGRGMSMMSCACLEGGKAIVSSNSSPSSCSASSGFDKHVFG